MHRTEHEMITSLARQVAESLDSAILEQLGCLVKDGLLVVEETTPIICRDMTRPGNEFHVKTAVRLRLKDQEAYDKLKAENKAMKSQLESIKAIIGKSAEPR